MHWQYNRSPPSSIIPPTIESEGGHAQAAWGVICGWGSNLRENGKLGRDSGEQFAPYYSMGSPLLFYGPPGCFFATKL